MTGMVLPFAPDGQTLKFVDGDGEIQDTIHDYTLA